MKTSKAEQAYWEALDRLITNKAKVVDTKSSRFKFTRDAVGREAGKGKGYVRHERYPELCLAIKDAEENREKLAQKTPNDTAKLKHEKELKLKAQLKYDTLKKEYDLLMQDYLNVLRQNFELQSELADSSNTILVKGSDD